CGTVCCKCPVASLPPFQAGVDPKTSFLLYYCRPVSRNAFPRGDHGPVLIPGLNARSPFAGPGKKSSPTGKPDVPDADPVFPQQGHAVGVAGISAPVGGRARVEDQGVSVPFLVWRMRMAENEQMEGFPREGGDGPVEGG